MRKVKRSKHKLEKRVISVKRYLLLIVVNRYLLLIVTSLINVIVENQECFLCAQSQHIHLKYKITKYA